MTDDNLPASLTTLASKLVDKLPLNFLKQLDELGGDKLRLRRFKNLVTIMEDAACFARSRGLDVYQGQALALRVGLPWMEKASLCEDDSLRNRWAELFLSLATDEQPEYSEGATYVRILAELDPWDCKVLDYIIEHGGLSMHMFKRIHREQLLQAIPGPEDQPGRTILSLEKLVRCGCLVVDDVHVSRDDWGAVIYGGIQRLFSLTITGLNFHIAVSGHEPSWLSKEDEYRDDIDPFAKPGDVNSMEEHDRFVKLTGEFGETHFRLLTMAGEDLRLVRDYIRSVDGEPTAAIAMEGTNPHPVKLRMKVWQELCENGLVYEVEPETTMTEDGYKKDRGTALGIRFQKFITRES